MFTDTHCHISKSDYDNIEDIVNNAQKLGIVKMINNGTDFKTNEEVLDLSKKYPNIYSAIGIHPEFATNYQLKDLVMIDENIDKIVAIGEIGLDYHYDIVDRDAQRKLFESQLEKAEKNNLPVIVHSRNATEDTIEIIKKHPKVKGVIHCFSGSYETAQIYIKLGFKLGIGGVLTFKNSHLYEVIEKLPLDSIVLETDSPFLTPEPLRGHKNEPSNVYYVAQKICDIKNITMDELSKITEKTVADIFDI